MKNGIKIFNTAGPCNSTDHYMIPAQWRNPGLMNFVYNKQYFVIHASRQSGKTTLVRDFVKTINDDNDYYAIYISLEGLQCVNDPKDAIPEIVKKIKFKLEFHKYLKQYAFAENADYSAFTSVLYIELSKFCIQLDKPLVVMFDEADCLRNGTLITFLRQLRNGFIERESIPFIHSLALVGMSKIRDYKGKIRDDRNTLGSASPFNIVKKSLTIRNFTLEEVTALLGQHFTATGQNFSNNIVKEIYYYSQGQPWLTNAIASEIIEELLENDYSKKITLELIEKAVQNIILRRDTHIDSLLERLKENRVRRILEPIIVGEESSINRIGDDYEYVTDLGLIKEVNGEIQPSNPIYAEVIIRQLNYNSTEDLKAPKYPYKMPRYFIEDKGEIDIILLLKDFQQFWQENSDIWVEKYFYKESAPHLILMAFLQRVINGGGDILREYAAGRCRLDLCVVYKNKKYPIELKIYYDQKTEFKGIEQTLAYMDKMGCKKGSLIIFNRTPDTSWEDKIYLKSKLVGDRTINIYGC